jgi:phosphoribosylamine---glycine ligase
MGDPETEVVLPRIKSDLVELLVAAATGDLKNKTIALHNESAVTVVLASGGYPGDFEKGKIISGITKDSKSTLFHAGTQKQDSTVVTHGGRVMTATGMGKTLQEAVSSAYTLARSVHWDGIYYRKDIGQDLLRLEASKQG